MNNLSIGIAKKVFICYYVTKGGGYMAYTEMLNILIHDSGLTVKQIADKCSEYGVDITTTYISKLRNDKNNKAPSDKVSIALAKACGAKFEECLVVEAYLDKSPKIIMDFFNLLKKIVVPITMGVLENKFTTQEQKKLEKAVESLPMSQFIFEMVKENKGTQIKKEFGAGHIKAIQKGDDFNIKHEITQNLGLPISDDGMSPQIHKGDFVQIEYKSIDELKTGDIICFGKVKNKGKFYARKIVIGDNKKSITLLPMNNEYTFENTNVDDIVIFGKIVRVTTEIK